MFLQKQISIKKNDFEEICRNHSVRYIFGFGSSVNENFNPKTSDIDLVVEIDEADPIKKGEKLLSLWNSLEILFKRKIDLLTENSIKNPFLRKAIESSKVLLYDGTCQEIIN